ncbi:hypothetical protein ACIRST_37695 [Kitasatospora sp. NPDC101447]|uniref:hypothetical protein n=1 Tax=Kitasatospora sp. NPDC101447 TaxID=3364102 RepID=UPI00380818DD
MAARQAKPCPATLYSTTRTFGISVTWVWVARTADANSGRPASQRSGFAGGPPARVVRSQAQRLRVADRNDPGLGAAHGFVHELGILPPELNALLQRGGENLLRHRRPPARPCHAGR